MRQALTKGQLSFFELNGVNEKCDIIKPNIVVENNIDFPLNLLKYDTYDLEKYKQDVLNYGLKQTWNAINYCVLYYGISNNFLSVDNFAQLYEIGLALQDKRSKKESGQYYTPNDVAIVMSEWLQKQKGEIVCDVGCGTGNLILSYLNLIGNKKAIDLIRSGRLYLYDIDDVALSICKTIILFKYGKELEPYIHTIRCDFLSNKITLPNNCKVIANPPYSTINSLSLDWNKTEVALDSKELYSMFMEKIIKQSESAVIITPYSFVGGSKFYSLRKIMNDYNGFVISFDNVPGNIFRGKKHGIFNTNTANSVRAAISVVENKYDCRGFKTTHLIRFKNEERTKFLKTAVLESLINDEYQIVTNENPMYCKCAKELRLVWNYWKTKSTQRLGNCVNQDGQYILSMPNTCRYYTSASYGKMNRAGQIVLNINDKDVFNYIYCLINSSFAYWYWRLFDGGITYTKKLLLSMPIFYDKLSDEDIEFFNNVATEMINETNKYTVTKNNVGIQENVKYPRQFRDKINRKLLDILGLNIDEKIFDIIHSNMAMEINV